jgi:hypothetical protein
MPRAKTKTNKPKTLPLKKHNVNKKKTSLSVGAVTPAEKRAWKAAAKKAKQSLSLWVRNCCNARPKK